MNPMTQKTLTLDARPTRHILSISGGKDSTALAVYMRDRVPDMEYAFCDTGEELEETYDYIDRLSAYLGKEIVHLNPDRPFSHYLEMWGGLLPNARTRWCTHMLKIKPFERYVGDDPVISYVGIRADEDREGYVSTKPNIKAVFPFKEDGITKSDVHRILEEAGLGLPDYYQWRTRSGCYFCFFQRRSEWVGLLKNHPEKFDEAKRYEKINKETGESYTWNGRESLEELAAPERVAEIMAKHEEAVASKRSSSPYLLDVLQEVADDESDSRPCLICEL
jgi:3'-phosphoadenosine 5'-phosphosulfate sulfotransferase (PAPS reductase)/FAD synthetase